MVASAELPGPIEPFCSIERAVMVVGDRWSFLVLREILLYGRTRFADVQRRLGIATNVLTGRLEALVSAGVLERRPYREQGDRERFSYHATPAGEDLVLVLAALQQWGDAHEPRENGPTVLRRTADGSAAHVAFVDERGAEVSADEMVFEPTPEHPAYRSPS